MICFHLKSTFHIYRIKKNYIENVSTCSVYQHRLSCSCDISQRVFLRSPELREAKWRGVRLSDGYCGPREARPNDRHGSDRPSIYAFGARQSSIKQPSAPSRNFSRASVRRHIPRSVTAYPYTETIPFFPKRYCSF